METIMKVLDFLFGDTRRRVRYGFALIKFGGGVTDVRGSIGGSVFSRNRYGAYARNRTIPVNPSSTAQQKIRSIMSVVRAAWFNTLTAAQRAAWASYAAAVQVQNRLGETITLTGFNHFARSASALLYNDVAIVADGPTDNSLPETDETVAYTPDESSSNVSIAFDTDAAWVGETGAYMLVYASRPQNPTVNYFKGPYRIAGKIAGNTTTPPTSPQTVNLPFAAAAGQKVFFQTRIVRADGRLSEPFRGVGTVVS